MYGIHPSIERSGTVRWMRRPDKASLLRKSGTSVAAEASGGFAAGTITSRGKAVADLVPSEAARAVDARTAIERFQAFLRENPVKAIRDVDIKALIENGRE